MSFESLTFVYVWDRLEILWQSVVAIGPKACTKSGTVDSKDGVSRITF